MFDVLIKGGKVCDGLSNAPRVCDVALSGDTIADVGDLAEATAHETLEAAGKLVCPGFIDVHSHSDAYLLLEPQAACKLYQGVTTEIVGNCGASAAPLHGEYRMPSDWADKTYPAPWKSVADYGERLAEACPAINVVLLIGHNTLRAGVRGYGDGHASPDELSTMIRRLEQALEEGGRGLSSGLEYVPGMFAPPEELFALVEPVARRGGIYTSHMRSEAEGLVDSVNETLAVGRATGVRVQVSHFKALGRRNWHLLEPAIECIAAAQADGMAVAADRYPYTCSSTNLDVIFPAWSEDGGRDAVLARLRDASTRRRIREDLLAQYSEEDWQTITIGSTAHLDNQSFRGQSLCDVARALDLDPVDAVLHLTDSDDLETTAFFFGMREENMHRVFGLSYVMLGSDGSLRAPEGPLSHDHPHPRAYGSFSRFLRMALDGQSMSLTDAIKKMTSLSAETFGLTDRGVLSRGKKADVVVLDPERVRDCATFGTPHQFSEGVCDVVVNGTMAMRDGELTGARAGQFLR